MSARGSQGGIDLPRGAVALSGGVDSAVAALLLRDQGFSLVGLTMHLSGPRPDLSRLGRELGIDIHVLDVRQEFQREVVDAFCSEYARGRTPNPCVACNRVVKFGYLARYAQTLGVEFLATGHYARRRYCPHRQRYVLEQAVSRDKDQSYMLYGLTQEQLAFARFPLGEYAKVAVRRLAQERGLSAGGAPESQDICFIDGDYRRFLEERQPGVLQPGPIVNRQGQVLGTHPGLAGFTIGQRRGLGVAGPQPYYVIAVDLLRNALVVGAREESMASALMAWPAHAAAGSWPQRPLHCTVKVRYRAPQVDCWLEAGSGAGVQVTFQEPQPAVTPGQSAVFYCGAEVLGGGIIQRVCMAPPRGGHTPLT